LYDPIEARLPCPLFTKIIPLSESAVDFVFVVPIDLQQERAKNRDVLWMAERVATAERAA
jgi:hypothetical protein